AWVSPRRRSRASPIRASTGRRSSTCLRSSGTTSAGSGRTAKGPDRRGVASAPVQETLRRTPLHDRHVALGARMVPFAGWEMPVQYEGVIPEHKAVRSDAGVFDVSH